MAGFESLPSLVLELMSIAQAPLPEQRSIPRFLEVWSRTLECLHFRPDAQRLRADARRLVATVLAERDAERLQVGPMARWLRVADAVVDFGRRGPVRRVLWALVEARLLRQGVALSGDLLFAAGWPGENPNPESARNRLYVALSELRNTSQRELGVRELVTRRDDGYLIAPSVRVELSDDASPAENGPRS